MDVIFEPSTGKPFSIEVGFFDSVLEIKEKILKYQGIAVAKQTLIFNGQILHDDRDVGSCEILQFSRVRLSLAADPVKPQPPPPPPAEIKGEIESPPSHEKIQLLLQMPAAPPPRSPALSLEMDANESVLLLKEKIHEIEASVPVNLVILHANGQELLDHKSLNDCDLSHHSVIDISVKPASAPATSPSSTGSKRLKVMVQPKCGRKIAVEVNAGDNVGGLRKELQKLQENQQLHLPAEGYFFIYKQNVMDDDRSFRWHQVGHGDTVEIFNGSVTGGA